MAGYCHGLFTRMHVPHSNGAICIVGQKRKPYLLLTSKVRTRRTTHDGIPIELDTRDSATVAAEISH